MKLSAINLSYSYKHAEHPAVSDISFDFEPGCFYGIFGPNGSGKSTLLKLLRLDIAGTGQVLVDNVDLQKYSIRERAKFMASGGGDGEIDLPFTVREYVALGRYIWSRKSTPAAEKEHIDRVLAEWDLTGWAGKQVAHLSSGERQRVQLARIWAQNSAFVLLDEPGSHLDWAVQLELYQKLRRLCREAQRCVIMVCHDLWLAPFFLDQVLLLKAGRLLYSGSGQEVLSAENMQRVFGCSLDCDRNDHSLELRYPPRQ